MSETHGSHSSKKAENTRVKVKPRKKTVGITLPQNLINRARKHKLNISRITEQALLSVLDYLESAKPINMSKCESISQQPIWAGSLARLGRSPYEAEVAGSSPARPTTHFPLTFILHW